MTNLASPGFSKTLARREVLTLSFGAMIGWSWVLLTGEWLIRAGTLGTTIAFIIGGIAVFLCFALGSMLGMPADPAIALQAPQVLSPPGKFTRQGLKEFGGKRNRRRRDRGLPVVRRVESQRGGAATAMVPGPRSIQ